MQGRMPLAAMLRRDRAIVLAGIAGLAALAWAYVVYLPWGVARSLDMALPQMQAWSAPDFALTFVMWALMMVAMMVPSAAPMVLMYAAVTRRRREQQLPFVPMGVFLLGYLVVWGLFAAGATLAQWGLHSAALLSSTMVSTSPVLGGVLLLAAGVFQWSPIKYTCLSRCRSPMGFLMAEWREGPRGTLVMGLRHGLFCLGCCWVLMGLLFVLGVMNLLWIAALAGFILVEKVAPTGHWVSRLTGLLMIVWGALMTAGMLG